MSAVISMCSFHYYFVIMSYNNNSNNKDNLYSIHVIFALSLFTQIKYVDNTYTKAEDRRFTYIQKNYNYTEYRIPAGNCKTYLHNKLNNNGKYM